MVDNLYLENYVESTLNIYFLFAKFPFNHNGFVLPAVNAWDIPQVKQPHITVIPKYSNANFECPLVKFFTFVLKSWQ